MKKVIVLALALGCASLAAHAQTIALGVKAGANMSNIVGSDVPDGFKKKFGPAGGVMVNIPLTPDGFLSVQPEVLYSMKGTQNNSATIKNSTTLHYIDIPVLARVDIQGPFLVLGPQLNVLVALKREVGTKTSTDKSLLNPVNVGATAGAGYQVPNGPSFELRYNRDIMPLTKDLGNTAVHQYNSVFQFQVGYLFSSNDNKPKHHRRPHRRRTR